jgi:DNA-directed RNA polymerase subunit F
MEKMIFNKEETKNLIMMLKSEDADNHIIAFETLKNVDFKKYVGELLVLYKFGGHTMENWMTNCKKIATKLLDIKPETPLSSPKTLSLITKNKGSKASVELFMEFFIRDMTRMLESIGYPTDQFEIHIKLKDDGQTAKS